MSELCPLCWGRGSIKVPSPADSPSRYIRCEFCAGSGRYDRYDYSYAEAAERMNEAARKLDPMRKELERRIWPLFQEAEARAAAQMEAANRRRTADRIMGVDTSAAQAISEWDSSTHSYDPTTELQQHQRSTSMNSSTAIFLVTDKVRAIRVAYDTDEKNNNPGYLFKTFDHSIAKDDLVVVPTTTRHGFTICKVVEVDVDVDYTGGGIQYKWIAGKFDRSQYDATLEQEQSIIDRVNKAERARKRQELAAALKLDEVDLGDNPLLLAGASTTTEQAS